MNQKLIDFIKSLPAGIPYVGPIFSKFLANKSTKELIFILHEIKQISSDEKTEVIEATQITNEKLEELKLILEEIIHLSTNKITVIIPTGGDGESLYPITSVQPKCIIPIGRKPLILHILDNLLLNKDLYHKIIILTRAFSSAIEHTVNREPYNELVECIRIDKNIPTALLELKNKIVGNPFLVHYNDILIKEINWNDVISYFNFQKVQQKIIAMFLISKYYPLGIGLVKEGPEGLVEEFVEKPKLLNDSFANMGVFLLDKEFFEYIDENDNDIFKHTIPKVMNAKRHIGMFKVREWHHIHNLNDFRMIQKQTKTKEF